MTSQSIMAQKVSLINAFILFLLMAMFEAASSQSLGSIATQEFFNSVIGEAAPSCAGKKFYSYDAFISAANSYPDFGKSISPREVAAYFAHVTHETGHLCYVDEINGASQNYCDPSNKQYPCAAGKTYFGRGPLQLTWNYNYGACGQALGVNLLATPETVSSDPVVSFKTSFWFWVNNVRPVFGQGFGATIRAINGAVECNGGNPQAVQDRIQYFKDYCAKFGVDPGPNLSC